MRREEGFDAWMAQLEARAFTSVDEAAATMVELLVRTNREIEIEVREPGTTGPGWERLREIIRKAVELIRKIAQEFGAVSYSIGVSMTGGLEASVEWSFA